MNARPAGQDLGVGRGDVRVRAEHEAGPAVEAVAHRHLLARRLGVHVAHASPSPTCGICDQHPVGGGERVVAGQVVHEDPPEQREHADLHAGVGRDDGEPAAGGVGGEVRRADEPLAAFMVGTMSIFL